MLINLQNEIIVRGPEDMKYLGLHFDRWLRAIVFSLIFSLSTHTYTMN